MCDVALRDKAGGDLLDELGRGYCRELHGDGRRELRPVCLRQRGELCGGVVRADQPVGDHEREDVLRPHEHLCVRREREEARGEPRLDHEPREGVVEQVVLLAAERGEECRAAHPLLERLRLEEAHREAEEPAELTLVHRACLEGGFDDAARQAGKLRELERGEHSDHPSCRLLSGGYLALRVCVFGVPQEEHEQFEQCSNPFHAPVLVCFMLFGRDSPFFRFIA